MYRTYISKLTLVSVGEELNFIHGQRRTCYNGVYPYKIFPEKELRQIEFAPVTIFYGSNGSGKSTLLNILAEKSKVIRHSAFSGSAFFQQYVDSCHLEGKRIPEASQILTSDDVFDYLLNIRYLNDGIDTRRNELFEDYAEPGKSVVYQILKNSGCNWAGFSEITRKTLEDAARWRKTPHEVIKQLATQAETNSALIDAITEKAIPGKTVNISYDEMRLEYGEDIFGSGQPKKALAIVTADLKEIGITIQTGKTVKYDGKTRNGFAILQSKDEPEEVEIL